MYKKGLAFLCTECAFMSLIAGAYWTLTKSLNLDQKYSECNSSCCLHFNWQLFVAENFLALSRWSFVNMMKSKSFQTGNTIHSLVAPLDAIERNRKKAGWEKMEICAIVNQVKEDQWFVSHNATWFPLRYCCTCLNIDILFQQKNRVWIAFEICLLLSIGRFLFYPLSDEGLEHYSRFLSGVWQA